MILSAGRSEQERADLGLQSDLGHARTFTFDVIVFYELPRSA